MPRPTITSALRLSALSLLSFVAYTLMEMRYFLGSWIPDGATVPCQLSAQRRWGTPQPASQNPKRFA